MKDVEAWNGSKTKPRDYDCISESVFKMAPHNRLLLSWDTWLDKWQELALWNFSLKPFLLLMQIRHNTCLLSAASLGNLIASNETWVGKGTQIPMPQVRGNGKYCLADVLNCKRTAGSCIVTWAIQTAPAGSWACTWPPSKEQCKWWGLSMRIHAWCLVSLCACVIKFVSHSLHHREIYFAS